MTIVRGFIALLRDIRLSLSKDATIRDNARSALGSFFPKAIYLVPKKDLTLALLLVTFLNVIDAINLIIAFAVILTSVATSLCLIGSTYRR